MVWFAFVGAVEGGEVCVGERAGDVAHGGWCWLLQLVRRKVRLLGQILRERRHGVFGSLENLQNFLSRVIYVGVF